MARKKANPRLAQPQRIGRSTGGSDGGTPAAGAPVASPWVRWSLPGLCALAFVVRAIVLWQLHDHPLLQPAGELDDAVYVRLAQRVAGGDWGIGPEVYFLSPFYTYFVALVFMVTGGSTLAVRVVQVVLGTASVALVYAMARRWFGHTAATVAGALAALTGLFAFYEVLLLQSAVDPFLTALALYTLTRALHEPGVRWPMLTGVALGLLSLNRPNALPLIAVAGLGLLAVRRSRAGAVRAAALLLAAALTIAPVTLRNRVVAGEWVLISSHGGLNFYIGNNEKADGAWTWVEGITPSIVGQVRDTRAVAEKAFGRPLSSSEVSGYFYGRAFAWIAAHPTAAGALFLRKLGYAFNAADFALNYSYGYFSRDEPTLLRWLFVGPWLLIPLGLVGFVAWPRDRASAFAVWASFVPLYALSVAVFFVSTRYRLPLMVPLCATGGGGAAWLLARARTGDALALGVAAAALVLAGVAVNWDVGPDTGRANQQTEMVLRLIRDGDETRAERLLARVEARHHLRGLLFFRVGQAYAGRGDDARAIHWLERALAADPGQPDIHIVLGQALVRTRRYAEAVPHLEAAREAGVSADDAGLSLAAAFAELGRSQEAHDALREAVSVTAVDAPGASWVALGLMAMRLQDPPMGEQMFLRAIEREPALAIAHENLGLALVLQNRAVEAIPALTRAADLDPSSASIRYNLAVALAREGRLADARQQAETALRIRADYAQAREMIRQLDVRRSQ